MNTDTLNQEDFVLVETKTITCESCIFSADVHCNRPFHFENCEKEVKNDYTHYIYNKKM